MGILRAANAVHVLYLGSTDLPVPGPQNLQLSLPLSVPVYRRTSQGPAVITGAYRSINQTELISSVQGDTSVLGSLRAGGVAALIPQS